MTKTIEAFLGALGIKGSTNEDLEAPLRVRVSQETIAELDALEAFLKGHGFRSASRSYLVRAALDSYLDGVRAEVPEALEPPAKRLSLH